jgi:cell fate (sporulation/competence/biofilm development) regulator YlbF (YheA/YmcA/DUF963 family)
MIDTFINMLSNALQAMFIGSMAGGLVLVCEEDIPQFKKLRPNIEQVMIQREVDQKLQDAFLDAFDQTYNDDKQTSSCEEALQAVGSSMQEVINKINNASNPHKNPLL